MLVLALGGGLRDDGISTLSGRGVEDRLDGDAEAPPLHYQHLHA